MKTKGYLVFHLNLAFSSIEEQEWPTVIQTCYHPLLDLIEETGITIGIELTGWTLKQIERIDIKWIERFRKLLNSRRCELIGSGYCQLIGPLVPYNVNEWNQKLGIDIYNQILGLRPQIVLVNEMAYSSSLVDLYSQFKYKGFIMDRDNIKFAINFDKFLPNKIPTHAMGIENNTLPVLWSDSILFQKVQHYAHGDISLKDYLTYLNLRIDQDEKILPIYCNDAEVFDYRPGRFSEERPTHPEGEWKRIGKLINAITLGANIEFISPTEALKTSNDREKKLASTLVNASYPIPVKKQEKYNIARWAVTGRSDLWINTMCHRIVKYLNKSKDNNSDNWQELCELWASDLRTHITEKRWNNAKIKMNAFLNYLNIDSNFNDTKNINMEHDSIESVVGQYGNFKISLDDEGILLRIHSKNLKLELNLRRGLTIHSLAFASHDMKPCIGTLSHGYFDCISAGADFYSGGVVIELPLLRRRVTDLEMVDPKFSIKDNGNIEIYAEIKTQYGTISKVMSISNERELISLKYDFLKWDKVLGSVRLGVITLLDEFSKKNTKLLCANGGKNMEIFNFDGEFNHTKPSSTLVSASRGLGGTTGKIQIINNKKKINLEWDPSECAAMPMLQNNLFINKKLSRVFFSTQEIDDTLKSPRSLKGFLLKIST